MHRPTRAGPRGATGFTWPGPERRWWRGTRAPPWGARCGLVPRPVRAFLAFWPFPVVVAGYPFSFAHSASAFSITPAGFMSNIFLASALEKR